jgi:protein-L-isoaspartate(D-aspartate) O-methyltransferase
LTDRFDHNGIGMTSARTRDRLVQRLREQGISDPRVLERIRNVPRHLFVDEALASRAYEDTALPIGLGQTISQPWVVARMTEAIVAEPTPRKFSKSARAAATRPRCWPGIVGQVYSVERLAPLLRRARTLLRSLDLYNVHLRHGDGWQGWSQARALRRHHRDRCARAGAGGPARAARRGRAAGDPGRAARSPGTA